MKWKRRRNEEKNINAIADHMYTTYESMKQRATKVKKKKKNQRKLIVHCSIKRATFLICIVLHKLQGMDHGYTLHIVCRAVGCTEFNK